MTQKSELTPNNESLIQKLVFEKLQNEAANRGLSWEMLCDKGHYIYDPNTKNRRIVFTEDSLRVFHTKRVNFCIELDRWFKEHWDKSDASEEDLAEDLVRYVINELDSLEAARATSNIDCDIVSWAMFINACKSMADKNGLEFEYWTTLPNNGVDEVPNNMIKFSKTYNPPIKINGEDMTTKSVTIDVYTDDHFKDCFNNNAFDWAKGIERIDTIIDEQFLSYYPVPYKDDKRIPDFFVEMFQEHGVAAIRREAPVIPNEWVEEYAKTDDFRYLCEAAAQCCRSFCDFLHKKLDSKEEK